MPDLPYRTASPAIPPDPEDLAVAEVARRVARMRRIVLSMCLVPTVLSCCIGFKGALLVQFALLGFAEWRITALIGIGIPLYLGFRGADVALRLALHACVPRWVAELAAQFDVPEASLHEMTAHFR
jgi:hypothetical protein